MSKQLVLSATNPPPPWSNAAVTLYHGTRLDHARSIVDGEVTLGNAQHRSDFGVGFYTTTSRVQALNFVTGNRRFVGHPCALVEFTVDREALARLDTLSFVTGGLGALDFWSFVRHCRGTGVGHGRPGILSCFYDVVFGPVTRSWRGYGIHWSMDQISFHTGDALTLLNTPGQRSIINV